MTNDEVRRQKADLLLEHQEAEHELANFREKAAKLMDVYESVVHILRAVSGGMYVGYSPEAETAETRIRANLKRYREDINLDNTLLLIEQITRANQKVKELSDRKTSLGLK
jgi:hypothetical protein